MVEIYEALVSLQAVDHEIDAVQERMAEFEPQLAELDAPAEALEQEVGAARKQLEEMRTEARRLERAAQEKRDRLGRYEERLMKVRDAREEAAARTELDLVRKALDADEEDAIGLMDQTKRIELKLDDLEKKLEATRAELEPRRQELLEGRSAVEEELKVLQDRRENQTTRLDPPVRQLYERVRGGRTRTALAQLTPDGACGHCFSVVPIQRQTEVRKGSSLVRCEECGVIIYTED